MESEHLSQNDLHRWIACPICYGSSQRLFNKDQYWIRGCTDCHHRFLELHATIDHVHRVYGDDYFQGGGAGYPNYLAEATLLRHHGRRYAQLLSHYLPTGTLLDVGAAAGFILKGFIDSGWQGKGIEPNRHMVTHARTQLQLQVDSVPLEQLSGQERYDLVTMIQVVAHFFNFQQAFAAASLHTKPGGYWLIETWNRESWMARLLGRNWHEYSPPSVLQWFSPEGLCQAVAQHGFHEVARGRPAKWIGSAHAKSILCYKIKGHPWEQWLVQSLKIIPDGFALPYPAEDLFWILLKKSSV
jgi:2-polyprenyl-3-methyl-5-hydroxy-6-metoxy-1,4-benzoquinol methylase